MITVSHTTKIAHNGADVILAKDVVVFCLTKAVVQVIVGSNSGIIVTVEQAVVTIGSQELNLKGELG